MWNGHDIIHFDIHSLSPLFIWRLNVACQPLINRWELSLILSSVDSIGLVACHSNCMRLKQWINKKKTHPLLRLWPHFKHYNPHPPPIRVLPTKLHQSLIVLNNWHPSIDVLVYQERKCKCFFWNYFRTLPASKRLRDLKFQCEVNSSSCTKYKFKIQVHILF